MAVQALQIRLVLLLLLGVSAVPAAAQVPVLGRWQEFAYSAEAVETEAAAAYESRTAVLRRAGTLDDDLEQLARVRRISARLIHNAVELQPRAAAWRWELHTTSSSEELASCSAGGKLLIGSSYVRSLDLTDGELAMLIGHEVAHAIAEHQREMLSQVFLENSATLPLSIATAMARYDSSWSLQIRLAHLARIQESEADQLGMMLVYGAGWPTSAIVGFFRKLAAPEPASVMNWGYPPFAARLAMATTFARWHPHQARVGTQNRHPAG